MEAENYFLRYAFPCSFIVLERGEITEEEFQTLKEAAVNGRALEKSFLERVYFRAFQKIEKVAKELGKDKWNPEVLEHYFRVRHNQMIDEGMYSYKEAPQALKELCKIREGKVVRVEKGYAVVEYPGGKRPVITELVPELNVGNQVVIHYGYVVEFLVK